MYQLHGNTPNFASHKTHHAGMQAWAEDVLGAVAAQAPDMGQCCILYEHQPSSSGRPDHRGAVLESLQRWGGGGRLRRGTDID